MRKFLEHAATFLAVCLVLAFAYVGLWVGCALDDQCFEQNTGLSASDPRFARPK